MLRNNYSKLITFIILLLALGGVILLKPETIHAPINQTQLPEANTRKPPTTSIFLAGDIMLSRNVDAAILKTNDYNLPFLKVADEIRSADISFANLESPFAQKPQRGRQGLIFGAYPDSVLGLKWAGFDILSTANNHALDQGLAGIDFTIDHLINYGIIPTGTFKTGSKDLTTLVVKRNDILYAILGYSYTAQNDGGKSTNPQISDFNDVAGMTQDIISLKGHNADVVIVSMHAGTEYRRTPSQSQIEFAHAAIDAGADLVVGHHPHWIQTIEQYKGKWIFYSLGNFVFDQMWSTDTKQGLTVKITFDKNQIKKIDLKPVIIEDYCCPRWANFDETATILKNIGLTSTVLMNNN